MERLRRRGRIQYGRMVRDHGPLVALVVVLAFSALGWLYEPPRAALSLFLGLAAGATLLVLAIKQREEGLAFKWLSPFALLVGVVAVNTMVQLTGGPDSPLFPFYLLLPLVPAVAGRLQWSIAVTAGAFMLEMSSAAVHGSILLFWQAITLRMGLFLFFGWLIGDFFLRQRVLTKAATDQLSRMESRVRTLGVKPLEEVEEDEVIEALSHRGDHERIVAAVRLLEEVLQSVADSIFRSFECHTVAIFIFDREAETLVMRAHRSHSAEIIEDAAIQIGSGVVGWVAKEKKYLLVEHLGRSSGSLGYYRDPAGIASIVAVPVLIDGSLEGVVLVDSEERAAFAWPERDRLEQFAGVTSHILRYARAEAQSAMTLSEVSALYGMARRFSDKLRPREVLGVLADATQRIVGCERIVLSVVDTDRRAGRIVLARGVESELMEGHDFSLMTGLVGWVARHKRVLRIPDLTQRRRRVPVYSADIEWIGVHSFLGVPMILEDRCIGVLSMEHRTSDYFTDSIAEVVSLIVAQASVAVNRAELYEEMEEMAIHDGLTGLLNHKRFWEVFSLEIERSCRSRKPLTLLMLDIDRFKALNDRYGHPAGDAVLRDIASILRECVRTVDSLARYGGEEFAIVLVETDLDYGLKIAERIRERIETRMFTSNDTMMSVTASIGAAAYPRDAEDAESLVGRADQALYRAKNLGRNQVRCAEEVESEL
ncbi:hypothetical protein AMJ39_07880 [candidate division TA06 bacterium DG_24]|uniref:GGDEF domain-containing protein n=1 Tax=candidate division TA06 bacterium DG_24 TaxID=1703770 RepID=A0A0S7WQF5_UNCT6|nr:MAG: hypothetical protein AMJ39_07880 [candidate division TA06 bacterium DG_24]